MTSNYFLQYIAGYTVTNFLCYPIRRRVTKASALEYLFKLYLPWWKLSLKRPFTSKGVCWNVLDKRCTCRSRSDYSCRNMDNFWTKFSWIQANSFSLKCQNSDRNWDFSVISSPASSREKLTSAFELGSCNRVPTSSENHGKPGKSLKKFHAADAWKNHGIWKNLNNHGKIIKFCEIIDKTTSSQKTSCGTLVLQLVFWLLVVSSFNYFKMHAWSTSRLLLLHFAFMLSVVKLLLKGEFWGCALNSQGNYIFDHGKIMDLCFWIPVGHKLTSTGAVWLKLML